MPSYEKDKNSGLWSVRFRITGKDGTIHQKRLSSHKTKRDAQYAYEDFIAAYNAENLSTLPEEHIDEELTFETLYHEFLAFKKPRIRETSYYDLMKKTDNKIYPFFKDYKIANITPATILEWQHTIEKYSFKYQKNLFQYLSAIYSFGERYHDIINIMHKVDRPRNTKGKKEMLFYTPEEFRLFSEHVTSPEYKMFFELLFITGARRGEALALTWKDVDLVKRTIKINKTAVFKVGTKEKPWTINPPKTEKSDRTIRIPEFLADKLRTYKNECRNPAEQTFVFFGTRPLPPTTIDRKLSEAANAAGIKKIRIHDFRHSCASILLHSGVSIVATSRYLGHSSVQETLDTYSHMLPDDQDLIERSLSNVGSRIFESTKCKE